MTTVMEGILYQAGRGEPKGLQGAKGCEDGTEGIGEEKGGGGSDTGDGTRRGVVGLGERKAKEAIWQVFAYIYGKPPGIEKGVSKLWMSMTISR